MLKDNEPIPDMAEIKISALNVARQVPWENLKGAVILGLEGEGKANKLYMSSISVNDLVMLSNQLQAHIAYLLGPMDEGF